MVVVLQNRVHAVLLEQRAPVFPVLLTRPAAFSFTPSVKHTNEPLSRLFQTGDSRAAALLRSAPQLGESLGRVRSSRPSWLFSLCDTGEAHHSQRREWPFVVVGGTSMKLKTAGRYLRYPDYGSKGHKTIGNWYNVHTR